MRLKFLVCKIYLGMWARGHIRQVEHVGHATHVGTQGTQGAWLHRERWARGHIGYVIQQTLLKQLFLGISLIHCCTFPVSCSIIFRIIFLATETYLMMKMLFMSNSRYFNFCLDFLVLQENGLIRKIRLISKSMTSTWFTNNCNTDNDKYLKK